MTRDRQPATVLVVDDEQAYVDAYTTFLDDVYEVRTATSGEEALAKLDADVDVVLLDRRMPDRAGDDVLRTIRQRDLECRVAMVTAVDPGVDIVDMPFDEYLVKPVSRDELRSVVEELLVRADLDAVVQECFALASKKSALEANVGREELEASREYAELQERLDAVEDRIDEALNELIAEGKTVAAYRDLKR